MDHRLERRNLVRRGAAVASTALMGGAGAPILWRGQPQATPERMFTQATESKVTLITGTNSGFGYLTSLTLARQGHTVFAAMRDSQERNAAAAAELVGIAETESLALKVVDIDVTSTSSVEQGVSQVVEQVERVDVLINNAGIFYPALLETQTVEQVLAIFETDAFGSLRMNRAVLPAMRRQGTGLVVQVTSGFGRIVAPFQGAYVGAKFAAEAMAEVSRYELSQYGVDVVIVEPGAYPTRFQENGRRYYEEYLAALTPEDAERLSEYGEFGAFAENFLRTPDGPDPQQVADAISVLIQTPAGERPLRTTVGADTEALRQLNAATDQIQTYVLEGIGLGDTLSVMPEAERHNATPEPGG